MADYTGNELNDTKIRLKIIEGEIDILRKYIQEYTGYLKIKNEVKMKMQRRIIELETRIK